MDPTNQNYVTLNYVSAESLISILSIAQDVQTNHYQEHPNYASLEQVQPQEPQFQWM